MKNFKDEKTTSTTAFMQKWALPNTGSEGS